MKTNHFFLFLAVFAITLTLGCEEKSGSKSSSSADEGLSSAADISASPGNEGSAHVANGEEEADEAVTESEVASKAAAEYIKAEKEKALKEGLTFTDSRDGKTYMLAKIGTQTWMAENLNYETKGSKCSRIGTEIYDRDSDEEGEPNIPRYILEDENTANCDKYGRLYNYATAKSACPKEWHLPSDKEWQTLVDFAGGEEVAVKKLKAKSGWIDGNGPDEYSGNGTDEYGFSALPGGYGYYGNLVGLVGGNGGWWSASDDSANSYGWVVSNYGGNKYGNGKDNYFFSIRCLK